MNTKVVCALVTSALLSACGGGSTASPRHAVTKETKGASVTLTEVEVTGRPDSSGFIPPAPAGATYVVVTYTIKNTGGEALSLENWPQPRLADAAGHLLEPDLGPSTFLSAKANVTWAENINPNLTTSVKRAWKVDEKAFDRKRWTLVFLATPKLMFALQ